MQESPKLRKWFVWSKLACQINVFALLILGIVLLIDGEFPSVYTVGAHTTR